MRQSKSTAAGAAETRLLAAADIDQDGWISYGEWLLLLALLAIPEHELKAVFNVVDLDGNGEIDFKEFDLVMQVRGGLGGRCTGVGGSCSMWREGGTLHES